MTGPEGSGPQDRSEPLGADAGGPAGLVPSADVYELEEFIVVRMALPGALEEDIDVSFGPEGLTVRGELEAPVVASEGRAILREWRYGYFERSIPLPCEVDSGGLRASLEAGVLELRLPKRSR